MAHILVPLTNSDKFAIIDCDDYEKIKPFSWCMVRGTTFSRLTFYAGTNLPRIEGGYKFTKMHRILMDAPDHLVVDHINGDGLDNRRENLRLCTSRENARNRHVVVGKTSKFKGVMKTRWNSFEAYIKNGIKRIRLGNYKTEQEAAVAYNKAAIRIFGAFARLNEV